MAKYRYLDNAYWEEADRSKLKCIKMTQLEDGREKKTILEVDRLYPDGREHPVYKEVVSTFGIDRIDHHTEVRKERKEKERREHEIKKAQEVEARKLEDLFSAKLRAFEIPTVKETKNKSLRTRIRRAENTMEVQALVTLIIGESLGMFGETDD